MPDIYHSPATSMPEATERPVSPEIQKLALEKLKEVEKVVQSALMKHDGIENFLRKNPDLGELSIQQIALSLMFTDKNTSMMRIREKLPETEFELPLNYEDIANRFSMIYEIY
jgi:hypothetical protein